MGQSVIDLSKMTPEAIKANVFKQTSMSPLSVYPFFIGVGFLAFWFIFNAGWIFTAIGALAVIFGPSWFSYNYFGRYDYYSTQYFRKLRAENEVAARKKLKSVQQYLDERGWDQAAAQVDKIQAKMEAFERVLKKKFEEGEMAYARYHSVAEQVFLNSLETLENLVTQLEAIDTIDPTYIQHRVDELYLIAEKNNGLSASQMEERESLDLRWKLREDTLGAVDTMLAQNEKAMTELDEIASKIARSKTDGRDTDAILRESIERLNQLGDEADKHWG